MQARLSGASPHIARTHFTDEVSLPWLLTNLEGSCLQGGFTTGRVYYRPRASPSTILPTPHFNSEQLPLLSPALQVRKLRLREVKAAILNACPPLGAFFVVTAGGGEGVLLASSGLRPGMLLKSLQFTGPSPPQRRIQP